MLPMMPNPISVAIKKHLFEMLKERYVKSEKFIERISMMMVTKDDYESLATLMSDLYEAGFMRALDQYKGQLAKMGMKVEVVPEEEKPRPGKKIFND